MQTAMTKRTTAVRTGLDLKLARVAAGVTQTDLARQMGIWRQTVSVVEGSLRPRPRVVEHYLKALHELADR